MKMGDGDIAPIQYNKPGLRVRLDYFICVAEALVDDTRGRIQIHR